MKRLSFSFSILILTFVWIYHTAATDYSPAINSIIGDISYVKKFGHLPSPDTDRNTRISTHLAYAEKMVRENNTAYNKEVAQKRRNILDHLHNYRVVGSFPEQNNSPGVCLFSEGGRTCAICYLVEKSAGRETAENVSKDLKKCKIAGVKSAALTDWIRSSGLTREEVEIIQPSYH